MISIITVCYNNQDTIGDTIQSVVKQEGVDYQYIVIDGASTDGTLDVVYQYEDKIDEIISEKDDSLWHAMNKGISLAKGEWIIFINADDCYSDDSSLKKLYSLSGDGVDIVFGTVLFVDRDSGKKIVRKYRFNKISMMFFRLGLMPAHPATLYSAKLFRKYGSYDLLNNVAPDFEILVRFYVSSGGLRWRNTAQTIVRMRDGGIGNSSISYKFKRITRQVRSCKINSVWTSWFIVLAKYPYKILEWVV